MSGRLKSIRFAAIAAAVTVVHGYRHARQHTEPTLKLENEQEQAPEEPSPAIVAPEAPTIPEARKAPHWFCDFTTSMNAVLAAHYNGFVSGCAWAITHPDSFESLRVQNALIDERFVRMAGRYAQSMTDHVAAATIAGHRGGLPDPSMFTELDLE